MPQQFVVPQFIDVEDKIIGPISVRQFVYFLVGGGLIVMDYQLLYKGTQNFVLFFLTSVGLFILTMFFSFFRFNGQPFHYFLLNLITSYRSPHLRVWNKATDRIDYIRKPEKLRLPPPIPSKKPLTPTKLTQLSLVVDTGGAYHEEENVAFDLESINRRESLFTPPNR